MIAVTILLGTAATIMQVQPNTKALLLLAAAMGAENGLFLRDGEVSIGLTYMTGSLVRMAQRLAGALMGDADRWTWGALSAAVARLRLRRGDRRALLRGVRYGRAVACDGCRGGADGNGRDRHAGQGADRALGRAGGLTPPVGLSRNFALRSFRTEKGMAAGDKHSPAEAGVQSRRA